MASERQWERVIELFRGALAQRASLGVRARAGRARFGIAKRA